MSDEATAWWPSPFGPEDQLGMLNHVDDAKRREALALVREGRMYDLSHDLHEDVPVFPGRYFRQTLFVDGGLTLYPSFETTWSSE